MSFLGLNYATYTFRNVPAKDAVGGFILDGTGRPSPRDASEGNAYTMLANIQPYLGVQRARLDSGVDDTHRLQGYAYADFAGVFPDLHGSESGDRVLASVIEYGGSMYKIELVKDWTRGLLPHIYFEAERITMSLGQDDPTDWEA
jgi:hypothetical protein